MQDDSASSERVEKLIGIMLEDTDHEKSRNATWELSQMDNKSLIDPFITVIYGNCESIRSVEDPLNRTIRFPAAWQQKIAIQGLGNIGDRRGVEALIFALKEGGSYDRENWTFHAAKALARIGDERAIEPLISILEQADSHRCGRDEEGVQRLEITGNELYYGDRNGVKSCISALGDFDNDNAIQELTNRLDDPDQGVRHSVATALGGKHNTGRKEVKAALLRKIREGGGIQYGISLSKIGGDEEALQLLEMIGDDNDVSHAVILPLWRIAPMLAIEPLINLLRDDEFRPTAALILGKIGGDKALGPLLNLLENGKFGIYETDEPSAVGTPSRPVYREILVKHNVIRALGEIGNPIAVNPLMSHLDQDHPTSLKYDVIWALGMIGDRSVCGKLSEFADEESVLSEIAIMALNQINASR